MCEAAFDRKEGGVPAHPLSKRTSLETHRPAIWDWPHTHLAPCHNLFADPKLKWSHLEIITPPRTFELNSGRFFKASLHWHPQSVSSRLQEATQSVHWALNDIIWHRVATRQTAISRTAPRGATASLFKCEKPSESSPRLLWSYPQRARSSADVKKQQKQQHIYIYTYVSCCQLWGILPVE